MKLRRNMSFSALCRELTTAEVGAILQRCSWRSVACSGIQMIQLQNRSKLFASFTSEGNEFKNLDYLAHVD